MKLAASILAAEIRAIKEMRPKRKKPGFLQSGETGLFGKRFATLTT